MRKPWGAALLYSICLFAKTCLLLYSLSGGRGYRSALDGVEIGAVTTSWSAYGRSTSYPETTRDRTEPLSKASLLLSSNFCFC